jgi:hypothetical protein
MAGSVVTVNELLEGHVGLSIECLDRIYLNGYVPNLQTGGQVVTFLTRHLGKPIPSPALFEQIGARFRREVAGFAKAGQIPVVRFDQDACKVEVMHPYQQNLAAAGVSGVAAIGVAQEFALVWTGSSRESSRSDLPQFTFAKVNRRSGCWSWAAAGTMTAISSWTRRSSTSCSTSLSSPTLGGVPGPIDHLACRFDFRGAPVAHASLEHVGRSATTVGHRD